MAQQRDIKRVDLGDIEPPWRQTDIAWLAIKEGVKEIYSNDYDGYGSKAVVIMPHRIQATFVCNCGASMVIKYYLRDVLHGHIAMKRRCSCRMDMKRKFIGAERDVPLEQQKVSKPKPKKGESIQTTIDEMFSDEENTSEIDDDDIMD